MKLIPSKKQWGAWSLPSKASYIGLVLAIVFFLGNYSTYLYYENFRVRSDHPKIVVNSQNKPFLRYKEQESEKISFTYELSFKNKGKNTATQVEFSEIIQKLKIDKNVVAEVHYGKNEEKTT